MLQQGKTWTIRTKDKFFNLRCQSSCHAHVSFTSNNILSYMLGCKVMLQILRCVAYERTWSSPNHFKYDVFLLAKARRYASMFRIYTFQALPLFNAKSKFLQHCFILLYILNNLYDYAITCCQFKEILSFSKCIYSYKLFLL
jgi:hypothetical protein